MLLPNNLCVHGLKVRVKKRNFRRTSLLKHGRFLKNLEIYPIPPPIVEQNNEEEVEGENE